MVQTISRWLLPDAENTGNPVKMWWDRLSPRPGGKRLFSAAVGRMAPYTGSVGAQIIELAPGRSQVVLQDRPALRNHIRCVHAIALCNLSELAGNIAVVYAMPDDTRFIVAGLSIDYIKKARGTITATCEVDLPDVWSRHEIPVTVQMRYPDGDVVATASLRTLVGPKKRA